MQLIDTHLGPPRTEVHPVNSKRSRKQLESCRVTEFSLKSHSTSTFLGRPVNEVFVVEKCGRDEGMKGLVALMSSDQPCAPS